MKRLKTIIKENTTLKDKELTIWKEHPNYTKKFDEIKSFCQSNSFTEDDSWKMMDSFEKEYFEKLQYELSVREDEIRGLLKAIDFTYDYLERLIKDEKSKDNTEQK